MKPENKLNKINLMGRILTKFSIKEQYEMSLIAVGGMIILTTAMAVYMIGWMDFTMIFKVMLGINAFFGILFLFSMLASTYAQYKMYIMTQGVNDLSKILTESIKGLGNMLDNDLKGGDDR